MSDAQGHPRRSGRASRILQECSGACGDLGTFIPHVIGAITVAGLAPAGVLLGFGVFLVGTGAFYGLPLPVQPMKAVSAVILTNGLRPGEIAAAGLVLGMVLFALGVTGAIGRVARFIPQSVSAGLQLGLGILMGVLGLRLMLEVPWLGFGAIALLTALMRIPRYPAAPLMLVMATLAAWSTGQVSMPSEIGLAWHAPTIVLPGWDDIWRSIGLAVIPQLPLTLTNAVIVTASLCREMFPGDAARASEQRLALSTGLANLALAPLGAMPMCHGAGGLQAQYRFGARTGIAPMLFGAVLLMLGLGFAASAGQLFAVIPIGAVGALLVFAGADLALSRRLFDGRPSCLPVIGVAALLTVIANPAIGLAGGWVAEICRAAIMRKVARRYS